MTAGAGGVDREALVLRRAFAAARSDDMAKLYVQDVGDLLAALAAAEQEVEQMHRRWATLTAAHAAARKRVEAAEQRADTLAAAIERALDLHQPGDGINVISVDENGAINTRPGVRCVGCSDPNKGDLGKHMVEHPCDTVAALSSRPVPDMDGNHISIPGPVQPEGKQR